MEYTYQRYLASKESVDKKAISNTLLGIVDATLTTIHDKVSVIEVGCGLGRFVDHLISGDLPGIVYYTGIDSNKHNIEYIHRKITDSVEETTDASLHDHYSIPEYYSINPSCHVRFIEANIFDVELPDKADLAVAKAFVDIVPIPAFLDTVSRWMQPGALLYCPITFNGRTVFYPQHDLDDRVLSLYHHSMESRDPRSGRAVGGAHAGDRLVRELKSGDWDVLGVESSDWNVRPQADECGYPAAEEYFLRHILQFIEQELKASGMMTEADKQHWLDTRHNQIDNAALTLRVHNLDVLAQKSN